MGQADADAEILLGLRRYMQRNGWGKLPAIVVSEDNHLIDGRKRIQVARSLGIHNSPAYVVEYPDGTPDDDEVRSRLREELRRSINSKNPPQYLPTYRFLPEDLTLDNL